MYILEMNLKIGTVQDTWTVTPTPGYVLKFVEVKMQAYGEVVEHKCFINVCHCEELPPPIDDIDEDELAARIDKDDIGYRIPVSIGELDSVVDNKNVNQPKIDVLVNRTFYEKRLAPPTSNLFRHFFCIVICEAIKDKHHLELDPNKCVKLKNRTMMGCIEPMKIVKRPVAPVIQEVISTAISQDTAVLKYSGIEQPVGVSICLIKGTNLVVELSLEEVEISNVQKLRLRLNRDRIVLLADRSRSVYDFCVPFYMDFKTVKYKLNPEISKLKFSVPVVYP